MESAQPEEHPQAQITEALNGEVPFLPETLIGALSLIDELREAFDLNAGITLFFTLRTHTLAVLKTFERAFAPRPLPGGFNKNLFRLMLALHDIGKPRAIAEGDKNRQHGYTSGMVKRIRPHLPFDDDSLKTLLSLIDGDPIGPYLRGRSSSDEAYGLILRMASGSGLDPQTFFDLLTIYYQTDVISYTTAGGILSALDPLFSWKTQGCEIGFDGERRRFQFSPPVDLAFGRLESRIKNL